MTTTTYENGDTFTTTREELLCGCAWVVCIEDDKHGNNLDRFVSIVRTCEEHRP